MPALPSRSGRLACPGQALLSLTDLPEADILCSGAFTPAPPRPGPVASDSGRLHCQLLETRNCVTSASSNLSGPQFPHW